jgi:hypothetical protein
LLLLPTVLLRFEDTEEGDEEEEADDDAGP